MTPRMLYEQSDFASPHETLDEWHHRCHPVVAGPLDRACIGLIALAGAVSFGAAVWVAFLVLVIA